MQQDQSTTTAAPDAGTGPAPTTYTPRCTPAPIDSARADAIEALQAILSETAPLDIFDDLPDHAHADKATDTAGAPDAPRRHSARGRALRLSIRLRAATALLRLKPLTAPTPSSSPSPNPQSEIRNPKPHRPADTNDSEDTDDAPEPRRQSPRRSARSIARAKAEARKAESDRIVASIYAQGQKAYENYLEVQRQADLRHAAQAAAAAAAATTAPPTPTTNSP